MATEVVNGGAFMEGKRKIMGWLGTMIGVPVVTGLLVKFLLVIGISPTEAAGIGEKIAIGLVATGMAYLGIQGKIDNTKAKNGNGSLTPTGGANAGL